ncbi:glycosyltransferase family 4 protein [Solirhodobacter olei]|uniref:glycosyltransferase family 4 protein n=1 Tax=Solirhodobacter olei TaxID=2493082 RepID=UPI000FDAD0CF|nr:glycosyltransferase family 4 protein [Solirhodobacter olei]
MPPEPPDRLVIINDASTARGGATGLALLSAKLMRARGLPVTLFCGDTGDNATLADDGIEVVSIDGAPLLNQSVAKSMASGLWNARAKAALADFIARTDTPETVYHVHGWAQILSPSIFTALQPVAARTLAHAHDFFLACPNGVFTDYRRGESCRRRPLGLDCLVTNCDKRSYSHKLWRAARTAALRRSFAQSLPWGGIVLLHPGMAPIMALAGFDRARMFVARNPVTPYSATRIPAEANERFFFIGRIEEDKGIRSLIAATQAAGVGLTVVGDGPLREELARAHPDVEFTGWKTREEIEPLVQTARCVAVPARHGEPFGLVITEALQSGIPVIMGETSLLASDVVDKGLGFACDMRRPETLTAAIARLRDLAPEEVEAMSLHAMRPENALASSPEAWADRLLELYGGLLARG